jgi:putative ABC transport system permease protein
LIYRLVFENLKHRPVRTLLSVVAIGVGVTMILTLVGVSRGVLEGMASRTRGSGADILMRPPDSSVIGFSGTMSEKFVNVVRGVPHVTLATGTLMQYSSSFDYVTGIRLDEFNSITGGLRYLEGGPFKEPDDVLIDEVYARSHNLHAGSTMEMGHKWRVCGVVEQGKMSRAFADINVLQDLFSSNGKISAIWVKVDDPANIPSVKVDLVAKLEGFKIYPMEEFVSLFSADKVPYLKPFTEVVIGLAAFFGFLMVSLSMYTAVLERTREIGILKALGASPGYIVGLLLRETLILAMAGTGAGILMTYGTRGLMAAFAPTMTQVIVPDWYPAAAGIAVVGSLIGAVYPGLRAAKQDAIEALAYD